jgi:hypothetical protein
MLIVRQISGLSPFVLLRLHGHNGVSERLGEFDTKAQADSALEQLKLTEENVPVEDVRCALSRHGILISHDEIKKFISAAPRI